VIDRTALIICFAGLAGTIAAMALPLAWPNVPNWIWRVIFWVSIFLLVITLIFLAYEYWIKSIIHGKQYMWPIILMGFGILIFGVGIIWHHIQLSKTTIPSFQPRSQPGKEPQFKDPFSNENVIKAHARLFLLTNDQPKFKELKDKYERIALRRYERYIEHTFMDGRIEYSFSPLIENIKTIIKNDFNEDIDLFAVDNIKYDLNKPFAEEEKIKDNVDKYNYRKARYQYLNSNEKLDNLLKRYQKEIYTNQFVINEYAKKIMRTSK
jgi:hypothetical protein